MHIMLQMKIAHFDATSIVVYKNKPKIPLMDSCNSVDAMVVNYGIGGSSCEPFR